MFLTPGSPWTLLSLISQQLFFSEGMRLKLRNNKYESFCVIFVHANFLEHFFLLPLLIPT